MTAKVSNGTHLLQAQLQALLPPRLATLIYFAGLGPILRLMDFVSNLLQGVRSFAVLR